jgi:hypothetical protein
MTGIATSASSNCTYYKKKYSVKGALRVLNNLLNCVELLNTEDARTF